jgi:hypothetical protein
MVIAIPVFVRDDMIRRDGAVVLLPDGTVKVVEVVPPLVAVCRVVINRSIVFDGG